MRLIAVSMVGLIVFGSVVVSLAQSKEKPVTPSAQSQLVVTHQKELKRLEELRAIFEKQLEQQLNDYDVKKGLYEKDYIAKQVLEQSERDLDTTRSQLQEIQRWTAEESRAIENLTKREKERKARE